MWQLKLTLVLLALLGSSGEAKPSPSHHFEHLHHLGQFNHLEHLHALPQHLEYGPPPPQAAAVLPPPLDIHETTLWQESLPVPPPVVATEIAAAPWWPAPAPAPAPVPLPLPVPVPAPAPLLPHLVHAPVTLLPAPATVLPAPVQLLPAPPQLLPAPAPLLPAPAPALLPVSVHAHTHTHVLPAVPAPPPAELHLPAVTTQVLPPVLEAIPFAPRYRVIPGPKTTTHRLSLGYAFPKLVAAPAHLHALPLKLAKLHHHHHHHPLF